MGETEKHHAGFTLIELAIVLVVIGLIVGGVLVGQDLIRAAGVRATISQIEKYNTAANTFREKYGYLPGDIPAQPAAQFGFQARGTCPGQGDGNGIIEGFLACGVEPWSQAGGETVMFWVDLSTAHLIDGGFNTATPTSDIGTAITVTSTPNLNAFLPAAKMGRGNYIYVYAGSFWAGGVTGSNYYGLSAVTAINDEGPPPSSPALTVQEAYAIDSKIDDGFPQTGNVVASYLNGAAGIDDWTAGLPYTLGTGGGNHLVTTTAQAGSSTTCWDNSSAASGTPGVAGAVQHYSLEISNGSNVTCALSFKMQAGD